MDEILIEEKRYISSKRAAKVTGYAKDYIGQLCREGRVPARLVGRNWYVLEAAIHDHRFGPQAVAPARDTEAPESRQELVSPRYEALSADEFPPIIHPRQDGSEPASISDEQDRPSQHLQDSWKEWFERIADTAASVIPEVSAAEKSPESVETSVETEEEKEKIEEAEAKSEDEDKKEIKIPIRAIHHSRYQALPDELLPYRTSMKVEKGSDTIVESAVVDTDAISRRIITSLNITGVIIAALAIISAIIGSGYFDTYIISFKQTHFISGITVLEK